MVSNTPHSFPRLKRLALVVFGAALALLIAELMLQAARLGRWAFVDPDRSRPAASGRRWTVVCVGDSHTWGWNLNPFLESYPVQLERLLNQGDPEGLFRVQNLGTPGYNTSQVLQRLQDHHQSQPVDLVLFLAGFNNAWNPASSLAGAGPDLFLLPKLLAILFADRSAAKSSHDVVWRDGRAFSPAADGSLVPIAPAAAREGMNQGKALAEDVAKDLCRLVEYCLQQQLPLVVQTYVSQQHSTFTTVNDAIRNTVKKRELVALLDHGSAFCEIAGNDKNLLQPDGHPTAAGCLWMAERIADYLRTWDVSRNWFVASTSMEPEPAPKVSHEVALGKLERATGARFELPVRGPSGGVWQLHLSRQTQAGPDGIGIAQDELFHQCRGAFGMFGKFDAEGKDIAVLYPEFYRSLHANAFFAQAIVVNPYAARLEDIVLGTSEVIKVKLD